MYLILFIYFEDNVSPQWQKRKSVAVLQVVCIADAEEGPSNSNREVVLRPSHSIQTKADPSFSTAQRNVFWTMCPRWGPDAQEPSFSSQGGSFLGFWPIAQTRWRRYPGHFGKFMSLALDLSWLMPFIHNFIYFAGWPNPGNCLWGSGSLDQIEANRARFAHDLLDWINGILDRTD